MGLNKKAFAQCLAEERYRDEVMADYAYAAEMGVQSTPTFFLNGIPIVGAHLTTFSNRWLSWSWPARYRNN